MNQVTIPSNVTGKKRFNLPARSFTKRRVKNFPTVKKTLSLLPAFEREATLKAFVTAFNSDRYPVSVEDCERTNYLPTISYMFVWADTPQGHKYWQSVLERTTGWN